VCIGPQQSDLRHIVYFDNSIQIQNCKYPLIQIPAGIRAQPGAARLNERAMLQLDTAHMVLTT